MFPHYSPITDQAKTNLLPLVYPALINLGFDSARINILVENYVKKCGIKDLNSVYFVANDFETHYLKRLNYFTAEVEASDIWSVVKNYLKDKKRTLSSANFLALHRLGIAVDEGKSERIIQALAYYDCVATELKISGSDMPFQKARKSFITLMQRRRHIQGLSRAQSTSEKIRIIIQHQENLLAINEMVAIDELQDTMLETFSEWYLMTEDIIVLYVMLGVHALFILRDQLENFEQWLKEFWLHAQVFSLMTKKSLLWKRTDFIDWPDLRAQIYDNDDFLKILLFHSAYSLKDHFKLEFLRRVAQTIVEEK